MLCVTAVEGLYDFKAPQSPHSLCKKSTKLSARELVRYPKHGNPSVTYGDSSLCTREPQKTKENKNGI